MDSLYERYPWLRITTTVENYVAPEYYDNLLKAYSFGGETDLQIFQKFLCNLPAKPLIALELGPGTGRVTSCALQNLQFNSLDLVDLSPRMLKTLEQKFSKQSLQLHQSDSLKFLEGTHSFFDLIYTLWSFSHSIHQLLIGTQIEKAHLYVTNVLNKMVRENMKSGSSFYLVHFDACSEEQRILIKQWQRKYPFYSVGKQSLSKTFIDETFTKLQKEGVIDLSVRHLLGDEIVYESEDQALEIFLNFHLESHFNQESYIDEVVEDMKKYFRSFTGKDGRIRIKPGCFEYIIRKL